MKTKTVAPVVNQTKFLDEEFKKSSHTGGDRWACVEVAIRSNVIGVRHTRDASKTTLEYSHEEWDAFIKGAKEGQFDLPSN
jgi:hypothetical protein